MATALCSAVVWQMQIYRLIIAIVFFLTSFGLRAQTDTLFTDFIKLFPNAKIESKFLVKFLEFNPKNLKIRLQHQALTAKEIVKRTPNYILLTVDMQCGAGGMCEEVTLYSFSLTGDLISKVRYAGEMGDCGFMKTTKPVIMNDTILVVHANEWKGNCDEETTESESSVVYEYTIADGQFSETRKQEVELRRKYSSLSTELMSDTELKKISKGDLAAMRNELYASYGYKFKTDKWANYFGQLDWYKQRKDVVSVQEMTLIERINLNKIKQAEKNK